MLLNCNLYTQKITCYSCAMTNARDLIEWIRASIRSLAINPSYGSKNAVFNQLVEFSGLSKTLIVKMEAGEMDNPTADTIDKLIDAVKQAMRKAAA